jgi:hypothetical protein
MGLAATTAVSLVLWALMVWGVVGIIAAIVSGLETPR